MPVVNPLPGQGGLIHVFLAKPWTEGQMFVESLFGVAI